MLNLVSIFSSVSTLSLHTLNQPLQKPHIVATLLKVLVLANPRIKMLIVRIIRDLI
jgi:hypothetical protein